MKKVDRSVAMLGVQQRRRLIVSNEYYRCNVCFERVLMEKYRKGQRYLHCDFVDLKKAYDRNYMRKPGGAEVCEAGIGHV